MFSVKIDSFSDYVDRCLAAKYVFVGKKFYLKNLLAIQFKLVAPLRTGCHDLKVNGSLVESQKSSKNQHQRTYFACKISKCGYTCIRFLFCHF